MKKKLLVISSYLLTITLGFVGGAYISRASALTDKIYKDLETFARVIEIVDKQYVESIDEEKMILGAIEGLLSSLDPYTMYLPEEMFKDFKSDTSGKFGGLGMEVGLKDGVLTVMSPLEDSPAQKAGIKSGDKILKINNKLTKQMGLAEAIHSMRGTKGTKVTLTIWRPGFDLPRDFTLVRDTIKLASVKYEAIEGGYAYARITNFQDNTSDELRTALDKLSKDAGGSLKGIILDLRDDPGGLLAEAISVSDIFLSKGTIVSTKGRAQKAEVKKASANSPYESTPVLVMVNHGSASASEIVAGALKDNKRAKLLGVTTFGKGSVQTIIEMGDNAALKMTIAKYYTPSGKCIDKLGIAPDILVDDALLKKEFAKFEEKDRPKLEDFQKVKAIKAIKGQK